MYGIGVAYLCERMPRLRNRKGKRAGPHMDHLTGLVLLPAVDRKVGRDALVRSHDRRLKAFTAEASRQPVNRIRGSTGLRRIENLERKKDLHRFRIYSYRASRTILPDARIPTRERPSSRS